MSKPHELRLIPGATVSGRFLKFTLSVDQTTVDVELTTKEPGRGHQEIVYQELDNVFAWHRENGQKLLRVTINLWQNNGPFQVALVMNYFLRLNGADVPPMITVKVWAKHTDTGFFIQSGDPTILWVGEEGYQVHTCANPNRLHVVMGVANDRLHAVLGTLLQQVAAIAEERGIEQILLITQSSLGTMQHGAVENRVKGTTWPKCVQKAGYTTPGYETQPNWLWNRPKPPEDPILTTPSVRPAGAPT